MDIKAIREQFPILKTTVYNKPLVYLDNAATNQKPLAVINAIDAYYKNENSNIHRGVHYLSQLATEAYENVRNQVRDFIHAKYSHEIIFTRGTTEAINLVAYSFSKAFIKPGDEIIVSAMEHHSNIVPWQIACEERGATLKVIPMNNDGELLIDTLPELISEKVKIIAVTQVSNALGTVNPIKEIIELAHKHNIPVLIDGAQGVAHQKIDVVELDCDFYCFSGHKMYGPMGIGILYGKEKWLNQMPPYQGGGEMIKEVTFEKTTYNELPYKFEAGTPNVADVIGLSAAIDFLTNTGLKNIQTAEHELLSYCEQQLVAEGGITIIGKANQKAGVVSFLIDKVHPYDAGTIIDRFGVAVRTGHHCAQPVMDFLHIPGTIRASFSVYNTKEEIDTLLEAIRQVKKMFC